MSSRLPEPGSFEGLLRPARIDVASLVRLSRYPATEPYWSAGAHRFDDPDPGRASAFGTCSTTSGIEMAFAESVIHESGRFAGSTYEVPAAELTERTVVRFICERRKTLVLADLTGAALKALGLNPVTFRAGNFGLMCRGNWQDLTLRPCPCVLRLAFNRK